MKRVALLVAASLALPYPASPQDAPLYKDARQPLEVRVADLLGRMTLEEKVAQLQALWIAEVEDLRRRRATSRPRRRRR